MIVVGHLIGFTDMTYTLRQNGFTLADKTFLGSQN
jgi:hypothetical protein